jgi:hypothetical protein
MKYKKTEGSVKLRAYDLNVVNPKGLTIKKFQGVPFFYQAAD